MSKLDQLREMRERAASTKKAPVPRKSTLASPAVAPAKKPARQLQIIKPAGGLVSLLDGSTYASLGGFDHKHYNAWYQKHIYRPRKKGKK